MPRITWGSATERQFETGIDRGVLYTTGNPGVPWNGLVSVNETPTGGEAKPAYIDGYKFRNISSFEEFSATIEAFSAPSEFGPCDGTYSINNGLLVTQQPRKTFGFSYRTLLGDAAVSVDLGYKIHLIYNALAGPSQRSNTSLSSSSELTKLSWGITTLPPLIEGYKPTSHFVVDTRFSTPELVAELEDALYGTETNSPYMPTALELISMFQV